MIARVDALGTLKVAMEYLGDVRAREPHRAPLARGRPLVESEPPPPPPPGSSSSSPRAPRAALARRARLKLRLGCVRLPRIKCGDGWRLRVELLASGRRVELPLRAVADDCDDGAAFPVSELGRSRALVLRTGELDLELLRLELLAPGELERVRRSFDDSLFSNSKKVGV